MNNPFRKTARKPFAAIQEQVLAFTKLGCSRRLAAEKAGCSHTTIGRAARRDPAFAKQLEEAENRVDIASLTRINEAAAENKNCARPPGYSSAATPRSSAAVHRTAFPPIRSWRSSPRSLHSRCPSCRTRRLETSCGRSIAQWDAWKAMSKTPTVGGIWRPAAEIAAAMAEKPLRSPYEHPQWCDPDRPRTAKEVSKEAIAWIHTLSQDDKEILREISGSTGGG